MSQTPAILLQPPRLLHLLVFGHISFSHVSNWSSLSFLQSYVVPQHASPLSRWLQGYPKRPPSLRPQVHDKSE